MGCVARTSRGLHLCRGRRENNVDIHPNKFGCEIKSLVSPLRPPELDGKFYPRCSRDYEGRCAEPPPHLSNWMRGQIPDTRSAIPSIAERASHPTEELPRSLIG